MCSEHGCQTLPVPWAGPGSRYTLLFESFVLSWLKISTVDAVRKQLRLSWNAVDGIMMRAVKRGLARIKKPLAARHMNVDEVAFKKGHRYITVISDREGQALALTNGRGTESLAGYLRTLTDRQLNSVKTFSMDMNAGYIRAARIHLPDAVSKIAFDRFHVAKWLAEVVDKTRQNEHPRLPADTRRQARGTRFLWQYGEKWMTKSCHEKLTWLREQMQQTSQCWTLKELARDIWNRPWNDERCAGTVVVIVVHHGTAAVVPEFRCRHRRPLQVPAQVFDAAPGPQGLLCEVDLPAASVLRLQIALPLFFIADMPGPRQTAGIYQVIAVAQQAGDGAAPDFLHGMLLKEEVAPDAVFNIKPAAGDGDMNMRMLVELTTVGVQGAEYTDLHTLFTGPPEHGPGGSPEQGIEQGPVVVEKEPQQVGHGKCQSQSGRICCCSVIHCSVALCPPELQPFDLQVWPKKQEWVQSGEAQ